MQARFNNNNSNFVKIRLSINLILFLIFGYKMYERGDLIEGSPFSFTMCFLTQAFVDCCYLLDPRHLGVTNDVKIFSTYSSQAIAFFDYIANNHMNTNYLLFKYAAVAPAVANFNALTYAVEARMRFY